MQINVSTLWLALNSEYGERLLQIAQERSHLARELEVNHNLSFQEKKVHKRQIQRIVMEREWILKRFEEGFV